MSQISQGSFRLALTIAIGIFLVAFICLLTLGDFSFLASVFWAAVIAAIVWLVCYFGFVKPNEGDDGMMSSAPPKSASAPTSAPAETVAAPAAAADTTSKGDPSAEAGEAKRAADAEAAERAAAQAERDRAEAAEALEAKRMADEAAAAEAKRKADEAAAAEAAEAKRQADEAAAAEAEKQRADEAAAAETRRREEEAEAARRDEEEAAAAQPSEHAMTDNAAAATTPDYDGDGVREGTDEGTRPAGLDAPRGGMADDLKQIKGIGAKMEALCNRLGFWHFDQIASWTADEVAWVDANLEGFKGRVTRDTWVEQAAILAQGGETEFSKRVEGGDVY